MACSPLIILRLVLPICIRILSGHSTETLIVLRIPFKLLVFIMAALCFWLLLLSILIVLDLRLPFHRPLRWLALLQFLLLRVLLSLRLWLPQDACRRVEPLLDLGHSAGESLPPLTNTPVLLDPEIHAQGYRCE